MSDAPYQQASSQSPMRAVGVVTLILSALVWIYAFLGSWWLIISLLDHQQPIRYGSQRWTIGLLIAIGVVLLAPVLVLFFRLDPLGLRLDRTRMLALAGVVSLTIGVLATGCLAFAYWLTY